MEALLNSSPKPYQSTVINLQTLERFKGSHQLIKNLILLYYFDLAPNIL